MFKQSWVCVYSRISRVKKNSKAATKDNHAFERDGWNVLMTNMTNYDDSWWEWPTELSHKKTEYQLSGCTDGMMWYFFIYIYGKILNAMKVERHLLTVTRGNKALIQTMWQWNRSSFSWAVKRQWHESARTVMLEPCQHPRHPDCKYSAQSLKTSVCCQSEGLSTWILSLTWRLMAHPAKTAKTVVDIKICRL